MRPASRPPGSRAPPASASVLTAFLLPASPAAAFVFNEPTVRQIAPETVPFDWSAQKCTNDDIPDQPARAFREANGTINFVDTHHTVWRSTTTNLTTLTHRCSPVVMNSHNNTDPAMYDDKEWIGATWTSDGTTVYGLTHSEYQGYRHAPGGYCIRSGEPFAEKAEVLAERDHARHVDQRRVHLLAHDAAEPSGRRLSDPLGARQRPDRLLPAEPHREGPGRLALRDGAGDGRCPAARELRAALPERRRPDVLARMERDRFHRHVPEPVPEHARSGPARLPARDAPAHRDAVREPRLEHLLQEVGPGRELRQRGRRVRARASTSTRPTT